jgi:hypothetical protein
LRTEYHNTDNDQQQGDTHPIFPSLLRRGIRPRLSANTGVGSAPFTHVNTMDGWKRRVAKGTAGATSSHLKEDTAWSLK